MIKLIAAVSKNGVIGSKVTNDLPWPKDRYPEDMKFFRKMTAGATVICGRNTFDSFGGKPLPKRTNIIITTSKDGTTENINGHDVYFHGTLEKGIERSKEKPSDTWLIGGTSIYRNGMDYASEIYLTLIPEIVEGDGLVYFPWVDPTKFKVIETIQLENSLLKVVRYVRIGPNQF